MTLHELTQDINATDKSLLAKAQHKIDFKTKPLGSLGRLEELAVKMALIQGDLNPRIKNSGLAVFAGDHGVAAEGVSAFPAEVTPQMVLNFLGGGAAINVLCRHFGIEIQVVDMGVNFDFPAGSALVDKKVRKGTRNFAREAAMTKEEALKAIENGVSVFEAFHAHQALDIIGLGDMGIGNTASASAIIAAATGKSAEEVTGRGTGVDDKGLTKKITVIQKALDLHRPNAKDGLDILCKVGGFEIAGIAGCILAAARNKKAVVVDGIISTAGGLIAFLLEPRVADYLFVGHQSVERGQLAACALMGVKPVVDLGMRLGEGTGAAIAIDLIAAACDILSNMASFDSAGVSNKE